MNKKSVTSVQVRSVVKSDKIHFSRIIDDAAPGMDIAIIISALKMLFPSELFKIIIETYGA